MFEISQEFGFLVLKLKSVESCNCSHHDLAGLLRTRSCSAQLIKNQSSLSGKWTLGSFRRPLLRFCLVSNTKNRTALAVGRRRPLLVGLRHNPKYD